jgi:TolB-like protein
MFTRKALIFFVMSLSFIICFAAPGIAAAPAGDSGAVKVAILPFAMKTPANLNYLQSGVRDMLSSRIALQGKALVVDKSETDRAAAKAPKELSLTEALRIGTALKADFVLFGSITSAGQSVTIEAKLASLTGKGEPIFFYSQAKGLDQVMPEIDLFAQQINQKILGQPEEKKKTAASAEAEELATRNPEFLLHNPVTLDERDTVPIKAEKEPEKPDPKSGIEYKGNPRTMN